MNNLRRRIERLEKRQCDALDAEILALMKLLPSTIVAGVMAAIKAEHTACPSQRESRSLKRGLTMLPVHHSTSLSLV
jgi:hypothetical protein